MKSPLIMCLAGQTYFLSRFTFLSLINSLFLIVGHYESWKRGRAAWNASQFHRFDLSPCLSGEWTKIFTNPSPRRYRSYNIYFFFFLLQAFAELCDKLQPLVDGVRKNREEWLKIAQQEKKPRLAKLKGSSTSVTNRVREIESSTAAVSRPWRETKAIK